MINPKLLIISHVLPFPRSAGQQQRVYYKLRAFREKFHVTFLTAVSPNEQEDIKRQLLELCDDVVLLPSLYISSRFMRIYHKILGFLYTSVSGLKFSNYLIDRVEFSPSRIRRAIQGREFDLVVFEYWHAFRCTSLFHARAIPTVLDMHDILWRSYQRQLGMKRWMPLIWQRWAVNRYRCQEESAWRMFDALIAINRAEERYAQQQLPEKTIFYTPMGIDLDFWPYSWKPANPPRVAFYGGLSSLHNQQSAWFCYNQVMPHIWKSIPSTEFWIIGSHPPADLQALGHRDPRVKVTGFVPQVQEILKTMSVVLCPWWGTYGFRSRIIEVMALGVPVVATSDAVYGMDLMNGEGLFLRDKPAAMAECVLTLLRNPKMAREQSEKARRQVKHKYSYEVTYQRLAEELRRWVVNRARTDRTA